MQSKETASADIATIPVSGHATLSRGTKIVTGVIRAGDLVRRSEIPRRNYRDGTGYQRDPSPARVNRLATDLKDRRVDLPTAVLCNLRGFEEGVHLVEEGDRLQLRLNGMPLYVVDGQHRTEALRRLIVENPEWEKFLIPFVCMLGASEDEEMRQFHVVNSTAKSVRTDLALSILKQRAETDPDYMLSLVERGEAWKVAAQNLAEEMEKLPIWLNRIRFPRQAKGSTTITSAGMVSSLKRPLATPFFGAIGQNGQLKVLQAFWEGTRDVLPEPFHEPGSYVLQKSIGVHAMHSLLETVLELIKAKGWSVIEKDSYAEMLHLLLTNLQGDNAEGEVITGSDYWLSGSKGAAGSFSSNAGRRVLVAKMRAALPPMPTLDL